jgi:8-oxo-dGTP diphosphatase
MKLATLCYLKRDGKTLMLHRTKKKNDIHQDKWNGLGGKFLPGETPEECVTREILEESGYLIKNPQLKGILTFPKFNKNEDWYVFVFVATEFEGREIISPEGHLQWIDDGALHALPLWEGDKYFLEMLGKPIFFSGKFIYQEGSLLDHQIIVHSLASTEGNR